MIPKGFGWCRAKTDLCQHGNEHLWTIRAIKGLMLPRQGIFFHLTAKYLNLENKTSIISLHIIIYQLSWVHQRKVVHQGASFLSLQSVCMYTVRKTCESCFKSIIYKCLFYLTVSDSLQNLSKPNVSMCLATFLSVLETWPPTYTHFHYRHSAGGIMRGSCNPPDTQSCDF